jgi:tRNA threonylcarbamoyl adenosine modification protein (Sua5/YciO/YrdC/YwlC family)
MPAALIDLRTAEDPRDVVHRAVQALAEGKLVAFPTETVYGVAASAINAKAVDRLAEIKQRRDGHPFTLAIKSAEDAIDYVPLLPPLAQRLTRRCWPGPVTFVLDDDHPESLLKQLPASVHKAVVPNGTVGLRVPAHDLVLAVLRLTAGPLALTSANRAGQPEAVTAQQVQAAIGNDVDLIIDDGRSKFGQPSSVVRVGRDGWQLLRPGVLNEKALKRLANFLILFVCTGNTCRSPMAECLMKGRLADRLKCKPSELEEHGLMVMSAGVSAMSGARASAEAVQVMQTQGLDLAQHESQPLNDRLVRFADLILTMTRGHRDAILAQWPAVASRTHVLNPDGSDLADPIGGPIDYYRRCAEQIELHLDSWIPELTRLGALRENETGA